MGLGLLVLSAVAFGTGLHADVQGDPYTGGVSTVVLALALAVLPLAVARARTVPRYLAWPPALLLLSVAAITASATVPALIGTVRVDSFEGAVARSGVDHVLQPTVFVACAWNAVLLVVAMLRPARTSD